MRLGQAQGEVFCAYPSESINLVNQQVGRLTEGSELYPDPLWAELKALLAKQPTLERSEDLPFCGGVAGFIAYDTHESPQEEHHAFPRAFFGLYNRWLYIDHRRQTAEEIVWTGENITPPIAWEELLERALSASSPADTCFTLTTPFKALTSKEKYAHDFDRIKNYLAQGDCYQVNYAQAFRAGCKGSSASAMQRLLEISNPAYAAWLSLPEGDVLSLSPELLLKVKDGHIETRPIKGTTARLSDPGADAEQAALLQSSPKNRAENLMIVDLLRHDIGQHAETGSVHVEKLFEIESLPQVHHMVSTITATLKADSSTVDLLRDCFPGGSITGAPKKRAMEIIAELETTPRYIYCGSIGFINPNGDCQFNIAIRSLLRVGDEIHAWAGGGIVADSNCEEEYQECFDKMGALMRALEDMGNEKN